MTKSTECPHCGSRYGFAFGTCDFCGWNHLDHKFHWITMSVRHFINGPDWMIQRHADNTKDALRDNQCDRKATTDNGN